MVFMAANATVQAICHILWYAIKYDHKIIQWYYMQIFPAITM